MKAEKSEAGADGAGMMLLSLQTRVWTCPPVGAGLPVEPH